MIRFFLVILLATFAGTASANESFRANPRPNGNPTTSSGWTELVLDNTGTEITYTVAFSGLSSAAISPRRPLQVDR